MLNFRNVAHRVGKLTHFRVSVSSHEYQMQFRRLTVDNTQHLENNLAVLDDLNLDQTELEIIEEIKSAPSYIAYANRKAQAFFG